ncbi:MAG: radical SAM family heme chaperone HemW [Chitinophagaceae bacterium]
MSGIYIHIPFCRRACHYCNFHFSTSLALKMDLVAAILKEIEMAAPLTMQLKTRVEESAYLKSKKIETVYFGGGTPSLLTEQELGDILHKINMHFEVDPRAEITLEANPDDVTVESLKVWKATGINRLSIGVQSFFDEDLRWMNRAHNALQAMHSIQSAQQAGFDNISIDLIYGGPTLTDSQWEENVRLAIQAGVPHLSCYALTVEPSTPLYKMIRRNKRSDVDADKQATQFLLLIDWLEAAGFEHYEISNFARPGKRSLHNSGYWQGHTYLGLGPSAHSFDGRSRQWNVSNNTVYIQSLKNNRIPAETELLTVTQMMNEYIMTSLRTKEGLELNHITRNFGDAFSSEIKHDAGKYLDDGRLLDTGGVLQLSRLGKLYADGIAADLFR